MAGETELAAEAMCACKEWAMSATNYCDEPGCSQESLCEGCFGRELIAKREQARVVGEVWAEVIGSRHSEYRKEPAWPVAAKSFAQARERVRMLGRDPRLVDELARVALQGAAAWWLRRPARYR